MCGEPGLQLYLIVPPFVFCFNRSLVFKSSVSHAAFLRRRPCQQLLFYWLPHDAGVTPIPSLYLSLDTGTPIKSVQHSVPSPLPTMACIRPTQSSVTLIQFPLPACAPCFNSTTKKDTPAASLSILASISSSLSLPCTDSFSLLSPACPSFSISISPPRYHLPFYSDEFQIERGTLLISSVKMLCRGQCGHQCVH